MRKIQKLFLLCVLSVALLGSADKNIDAATPNAGWDLLDAYNACTTPECFESYIQKGKDRFLLDSIFTNLFSLRGRAVKSEEKFDEKSKRVMVRYTQKNDARYCSITFFYDESGTLTSVKLSGACNTREPSALEKSRRTLQLK